LEKAAYGLGAPALFRTVVSLPAAKGATSAACVSGSPPRLRVVSDSPQLTTAVFGYSVGVRLEFTKMHGVGNDFVVFDAPGGIARLEPEQLRRLADRHTGIGFDQALVLETPRRPDTAVFYRIFNSDGEEVEQCGNGARCIAALLHRRRGSAGSSITMDSPAGLIQARVDAGNTVSVDMGLPNFDPRSLPFEAACENDPYPLDVEGQQVQIGAVSMGNPHAVVVVESASTAPVATLGPAIERHPRFPKRVNAGFMEIVDRSRIRLRVYERGAGETLACGTGACAAVAVGRRRGRLDAEVHVSVRGGELRVNWSGPGEHIWLTGPAEVSFEGHVEV
jgi:diaminopimelate epimerase